MALAGKRLVIFGCGYVGSALARVAQAAGANVTALTRNPATAEALRVAGVEMIVGELSSGDWHSQIGETPDFAVNCVSSGGGTPDDYHRSYVDGMRSVRAWLAKSPRPVESFVYTSSTSVYPQGDGATVDETAPTGNGPFNGRILLEAEQLLRTAPASAVRRSFILRLAGIYGPGRHHLLNELRAGAGALAGDPAHRMNMIHRDDIVAAVVACLSAPVEVPGSIFNVADGHPAPRREVVDWLAARLGVPAPALGGAGAASRRDGSPVPDRIISSAKIRRDLGWSPRFADYRAGYAELLRAGPGPF
ncbi:MAG: NAD-dependent epimerase/dehydratase family protein [Opitutae bacterium]|nr:NAD-dependent epimerase/dehydratase family protein [Opitutae bacterium]